MSTLDRKVAELVEQFVADVFEALRHTQLDELLAQPRGRPANKPARRAVASPAPPRSEDDEAPRSLPPASLSPEMFVTEPELLLAATERLLAAPVTSAPSFARPKRVKRSAPAILAVESGSSEPTAVVAVAAPPPPTLQPPGFYADAQGRVIRRRRRTETHHAEVGEEAGEEIRDEKVAASA